MNLAAQWLSENKMKIGDIALELGYSNASKFAKAFQSVYGMLPKDYRKIDSHVQAAFNSGRGVVSTNSLVSLGYFCP